MIKQIVLGLVITFFIIIFISGVCSVVMAQGQSENSNKTHQTINNITDSFGFKVKYEDEYYYIASVYIYSDGTRQLSLYSSDNVLKKLIYLSRYERIELENTTEE